MEFLDLARERYSVRKFASTPVEDEKVQRILEAARLAPTGKNNQPQRIYVARSEEALGKMAEVSPCTYGAPLVFALCYDESEEWVDANDSTRHSGDIDAAIVGDHMIFAAWEQGIGSCWVLLFDPAKLVDALDIPEGVKPVVLIPMGYAAPDAKPAPRHEARRRLVACSV